MKKQSSFLFDSGLGKLDPDIQFFAKCEEGRQSSSLLMIASESLCPKPVREALTMVFTNKYAEGYPSLRMAQDERNQVEKEPARYLSFHRRYGDRRFYKGAEFSNFVEVLAQRRAAEIFANPNASVDEIFVNVQSLSGAAANNAVYNAFVVPGDTIMGMSLSYGGHLTHGSPFNRSGRQYKVVPYTVDLNTGKLDYNQIESLALEHKPKIIIAGASAYPWSIDWKRLSEIAHKVPVQVEGLNRQGAVLMADISHPSGLVVAGLFPNPVGLADVSTLTTHKTLCGPRGAIIISTNEEVARRIDFGVFPGEQGGPHMNNIAAKAVSFKIASMPEFKQLQQRIYDNCQVLSKTFEKLGLKLAYGGTDSHLCLIDLDSIKTESGIPLRGDVASNILDLCGITCNKNALPGDETGTRPRGVRFGTTVLSQLGFGKKEMETIAKMVYRVLINIQTFKVISHSGEIVRGKIDQKIMDETRQEVNRLLKVKPVKQEGSDAIAIQGERSEAFIQSLVPINMYEFEIGQVIRTSLMDYSGKVIDKVLLKVINADDYLIKPSKNINQVANYLDKLSDGYIKFDPIDPYRKIEGPVVVKMVKAKISAAKVIDAQNDLSKPYFLGQKALTLGKIVYKAVDKEFKFVPYDGDSRKTAIYEEHLKLTKPNFMVPFAGWTMPLWYTRGSEEHINVRTACGLFDVSHMGKIRITGSYAMRFIDLVTTNYVPKLMPGQSHYSYIFNPDADVMDDVIVYYLAPKDYLLVVNASNAEKIYQWLNAVNKRQVIIDRDNLGCRIEGSVEISKPDWVNVALQGRKSFAVLRKIMLEAWTNSTSKMLKSLGSLKKSHFIEIEIGGFWALVARTGYTGENLGYEIFVKPENAVKFWNLLLEKGAEFGLKVCGLAARDSLRTEAGLPLYGHELNGDHNIMPTQAGYGAFVKRHKPFFVGRTAYLTKEKQITHQIVRFKVVTERARAIKPGDMVLDVDKDVGLVTSCTLVPIIGTTPQQYVQKGLMLIAKKYAIRGTILSIKTKAMQAGDAPAQVKVKGRYTPR
ncbi:MAG: glycine cleavage system aminomethyltransferase GcvT [Candidatus Brocadiia bacterium]